MHVDMRNMDSGQLQSSEQSQLLDEIDALRAQGISHYVSLPQLIVAGDQSSGKSSVLEAISGIAFPTKDNLCTCFATEVILRKHPSEGIKVSIIPGHSSSATASDLKAFQHDAKTLDELPELIERAKSLMNIGDKGSAFSDDVLRLEVSGPKQPHLTIVDLPGLIHSENKQQSATDVALVSAMVKRYMINPRSIILAVVSAKNDYANQIVLKLSKEVDATGHRTMGVITKPDTLSIGSESEHGYIELANNRDINFRLGWHTLKNKSFEERTCSSSERDIMETTFFDKGVWKEVSRDIVGISSLRLRLSKVLLTHIKRELPTLLHEIQTGLGESQEALARTSKPRVTLHEQQLHLLSICQRFQTVSSAAVDGMYNHPFFEDPGSFKGKHRRLRARVQNLNIDFATEIHTRGSRWRIREDTGPSTAGKGNGPGNGSILRPQMESRVLEMLKQSRGRELPGMVNPALVGTLFQEQAAPWRNIVKKHLETVLEAVKTFLDDTMSYLADEKTAEGILREIVDPKVSQYWATMQAKLEDLLAPHLRGHPITYNHYFTDNIQKAREDLAKKDITERLQKLLVKPSDGNPNTSLAGVSANAPLSSVALNMKIADIANCLTSKTEADMDRYASSEVLVCMEAYYKVAMKTFIDNIAIQAVEGCLISVLPDLLTPAGVLELNEETVRRIAEETKEDQALRESLQCKAKVLQQSLDTCRRHIVRERKLDHSPVKTFKETSAGRSPTPQPTPPATIFGSNGIDASIFAPPSAQSLSFGVTDSPTPLFQNLKSNKKPKGSSSEAQAHNTTPRPKESPDPFRLRQSD